MTSATSAVVRLGACLPLGTEDCYKACHSTATEHASTEDCYRACVIEYLS